MGGIFSSQPGDGGQQQQRPPQQQRPALSAHDKAVFEIKNQRDKLQQYQKKMRHIIEKETTMAKDMLRKGDRSRAMLALKRKRYQEQLLKKSHVQLDNLQQMVDSVEFASMERRVFEQLKQGNSVLKAIHQEMSAEDVENLMLETEEAIEYQQQIDQMLSRNLTERDDEAVEDELDRMLTEKLNQQMPSIPSALPATHPEGEATDVGALMPSAPSHDPVEDGAQAKEASRKAVAAS
eukprot:TRINITY_DN5987_c0_g1_i1.p1 TRINITY_DN5987_c0_g1~~TRINITY_DN5987_c0_g1_i1.p1  ORF type:complete len:236 (-),score=82.51 TRINITY_DN5987_c0_g1_i1:79-786(-)